jgi:hypothetical protein
MKENFSIYILVFITFKVVYLVIFLTKIYTNRSLP